MLILPIAAAIAAACDARASGTSSPRAMFVSLTSDSSAVEIRGLARHVRRALARLAPDDTLWASALPVFVRTSNGVRDDTTAEASGSDRHLPTVLGRYRVVGDRVRFEPRFPFSRGVAYHMEIDTAALGRDVGESAMATYAAPIVLEFSRPSVAHPRTTRVVAIHPSTSMLPSNTLRWYVETSAPMEVGNALEHIRLLDESGREVRGAFLALDQELWDAERQRLTLLFDPGRVKRGVRTNLESGTPIVSGRRYRLVIDAEWRDGTGTALASGMEHAFTGAPADRRSPDPTTWRLTPPVAGVRAPLRVAFGEALDHALAERMLTVLDARGVRVSGWVELAANDSVWTFVPETPWIAGAYALRIASALEDLAGNNLERPFDVDVRADRTAIARDVAGSTHVLRFAVPR